MPEISKTRHLTQASWEDVPHLDEETKAGLIADMPEYLRDARTKGIPSLGAGAIFQTPESEIMVKPFEPPAYWPRAYGLDVGWNRTAAIWIAMDRETGTDYLYTEHYRGKAEPSIHADAIKARGDWIPGVIDPAARGRGQRDGVQLMSDYMDQGLDLQPANNAVEAGLLDMWQRFSSGRLKVFASCQNWFNEYRLYRRDLDGKVVKTHDHLMDATRYVVMSGRDRAKLKPVSKSVVTSFQPTADKSGY